MPTPRAALPWASFTLASLFHSVAWAQSQPVGPSVPMEYCASVNTADMVPIHYDWQSDGRCFGNCTTLKYALAIVKEKNCWCSNLIPNRADQKSLGNCQDPCPGYPTDFCGGDGVYGYMDVAGFSPTGTAPPGGDSTKLPSSSDGDTTSKPPNPPSVTTITVGGTVRTITATAEPTGPSGEPLFETPSTGLQTGAIVGIVVGVLGGLAVIAAFIWLWFAKRRRRNEEDGNRLGSPMRGGSSPGMTATPRTGEISENRFGAASVGSAAATWDSSNKRRSNLMPVDPRLDPFAAGMYPSDQNRSRESFSSLQDNQDYSRRVHQAPRVLRAMNPDPDHT
ncbi:hypothetical protein C8A00DRAFT_41971 [Chaetomidium leptoderma]|uniref:WSC domain-containing protein n=1 Tax=Chaetomidium leptoderma TaxID=669021 RepID=A0AAN7A068_9PEZI|nr:hypothetical protein C8A00DRAFT_41971 [Chaetomidium leptoderma]